MKKNISNMKIKKTMISGVVLTSLMATLAGCGGDDTSSDEVVTGAGAEEVVDESDVLEQELEAMMDEIMAEEVEAIEEIEEVEEAIVVETIKGKIAQFQPQILIIDEENQRLLSVSNSADSTIDLSAVKAGDLVDVEYIASAENPDVVELVSINTYYESNDFISAYIALFDVIGNGVNFETLSQYETIALNMTWIDGMTEMEKTAFVQVLKQKLNNENINIVFGDKAKLIADGHMVVETGAPDKELVPNGIHMAFSLKQLGSNYQFTSTYYYPNGTDATANDGNLNYDANSGTYTFTVNSAAG